MNRGVRPLLSLRLMTLEGLQNYFMQGFSSFYSMPDENKVSINFIYCSMSSYFSSVAPFQFKIVAFSILLWGAYAAGI
jgi:hypothetical protein